MFLAPIKAEVGDLKVGAPDEGFNNFIGPVIHRASFDKFKSCIDATNKDPLLECLVGGKYDDSKGFYIYPTVYASKDPKHELFNKELFGPVLVIYVYTNAEFEDTLKLVDESGGGYALTGSVLVNDRAALRVAENRLRNASGNFDINCKSTGAAVGQQPFGQRNERQSW